MRYTPKVADEEEKENRLLTLTKGERKRIDAWLRKHEPIRKDSREWRRRSVKP